MTTLKCFDFENFMNCDIIMVYKWYELRFNIGVIVY